MKKILSLFIMAKFTLFDAKFTPKIQVYLIYIWVKISLAFHLLYFSKVISLRMRLRYVGVICRYDANSLSVIF